MKTISEIQLDLQMQTMALGKNIYKIQLIDYRIKLNPVETIEITSQTIEQSVVEKFLSE